MQSLLDKIFTIDPGNIDYEGLLDYILPFHPDEIDYRAFLPNVADPKDYARNILCHKPIEVVLIYWPPGVESAIHLHKGFWGYVGVLEGAALNVEYKHKKDKLREVRSVLVEKGGIIPNLSLLYIS